MILSGKEGRGSARRHPEAGEEAILGRFSSFSTVDRDREGWEEEEDNKLVSPHTSHTPHTPHLIEFLDKTYAVLGEEELSAEIVTMAD
jgi:hypothetical protein